MRLLWNGMGLLRLWIELFPRDSWRWTLRAAGFPDSPTTSWIASELSRGSAVDIAEAGREIGRFDSRPWIERVSIPASVIVTTEDNAVPPVKQYELACALRAPVHEIPCDHNGVLVKEHNFARTLIRAIAALPVPASETGEVAVRPTIAARGHGRPRRVQPAPAARRRATV
jgi:3-oxoadipate enol-lactonase